jgi:hypothetical protein
MRHSGLDGADEPIDVSRVPTVIDDDSQFDDMPLLEPPHFHETRKQYYLRMSCLDSSCEPPYALCCSEL